ncbi:MAG TPA: alpha/beta hydrolase, partial [Clostridia bacterium]|nr:alpha/beta hydrolase [Clostridia bacterium]
GSTHVIVWGDINKPPLVLFHGVGDNSALMWIFNAKELAKHFHIYAVDTIGGPGKSCPNENYNKNFAQILWIDDIFMKLKIEKAYVAGVSNGSYITQHYGIMRPEKVIKMVCMAGSISSVGTHHPMKRMMKVFLPEALFPTKKNIVRLMKKLTGENGNVLIDDRLIMEHYTYLLKGFNNMAMGYHKIIFFNDDQIKNISGKCLFLRGDADPLGDAAKDREKFERYKLDYYIYKGVGHAINHEISDVINKRIIEYFA